MDSDSPFDQLHDYEVAPVSGVEQHQAVGRGGLELEEEVHGGVGLQRGQRQVAAFRSKRHRVGDDVAHAEAGVELAEGDVAVLALVQVGQAVEAQALQVADEVGRHHGDEAPLRHDARLDVVELQARVGAGHLTWRGVDGGALEIQHLNCDMIFLLTSSYIFF